MAVVIRNPRETRIKESGAHGTSEALLAGPASGSNRFIIRRITLNPDGCTARVSFDRTVVYFVHKGRVTLSHDAGELDLLSPGDTAVIHPDELHHLHNIDKLKAVIIRVASQ
ncbi:MAG: AraC family ligand binding domain-containing protein [Candidatus Sabulitectum sp.]|nr:AraC family ligand binding domain-containing protein [Candidatus Sabulitectum sp.]